MLFLALSPALAKCAAPAGGFTAQTTLPTDPTVFFFQTRDEERPPLFTAKTTAGTALEVTAERLPSPTGYVAWRVDIDTVDRTAIEVRAVVGTLPPFVHGAAITHHAPYDPGAPTLTDAGQTVDAWTCSHSETLDLEVRAPRAAAFRLDWTAEGKSHTVVLPDHPERLYGRPPKGGQRIELGHLDCLGESFSWTDAPIEATVTTLFPNGSESPPSKRLSLQRPEAAPSMK